MTRPRIRTVFGGAAALLLLLQLVPYGRAHDNPPVRQEPAWDTAQTRALAVRACYDCHSNETVWPAYSHIAPVSWLVAHDVDEGRAVLNFSEMQRPQEEAGEAAETVEEGEMPPRIYLPTHKDARLSPAEEAALIAGLRATLGSGGGDDRVDRLDHDD
jgi:mono/diheme cytochrome c family protein